MCTAAKTTSEMKTPTLVRMLSSDRNGVLNREVPMYGFVRIHNLCWLVTNMLTHTHTQAYVHADKCPGSITQ